jgi:hypothetical protein
LALSFFYKLTTNAICAIYPGETKAFGLPFGAQKKSIAIPEMDRVRG